jgi:hypothetical protein
MPKGNGRKPRGRRKAKEQRGRRSFREAILARCSVGKGAGFYVCERCGQWVTQYQLHAHHRRGRNLLTSTEKWDPALGHGLCNLCHGIVQRREEDWREWMEAKPQ